MARAQLVHYDRGAQTLALSGLPVVTWKGDEYRASRIFIDLDQDRIVLSGAVSGQITPTSEDSGYGQQGASEADPDPGTGASETDGTEASTSDRSSSGADR